MHKLTTPLGPGTFQGLLGIVKPGQPEAVKVLVRLPITDQTSAHLKDANCVTQTAKASGLWWFDREEVKA